MLQSQLSEATETKQQLKNSHENCQTEVQRLRGELKHIERNRDETDRALVDIQHHLTLVCQERDSLQTRLKTSQTQVSKLKKEGVTSVEKVESSVTKLKMDLEASSNELVTVKRQLDTNEQECKRLKKELRY